MRTKVASFPPHVCAECDFWRADLKIDAGGRCWEAPPRYSHTDDDADEDVYLKRGAPCPGRDPACRVFKPREQA